MNLIKSSPSDPAYVGNGATGCFNKDLAVALSLSISGVTWTDWSKLSNIAKHSWNLSWYFMHSVNSTINSLSTNVLSSENSKSCTCLSHLERSSFKPFSLAFSSFLCNEVIVFYKCHIVLSYFHFAPSIFSLGNMYKKCLQISGNMYNNWNF